MPIFMAKIKTGNLQQKLLIKTSEVSKPVIMKMNEKVTMVIKRIF